MFNFETNTQITYDLRKLVIIESSNYKDQYVRPNNLNVEYSNIEDMVKLIFDKKSRGSTDINGVDIASTAGSIMQVSKAPLFRAGIENGWGEKRGIFVAEIVRNSGTGYGEHITYLQGYTSYWGIANSGAIDPKMRFYINNIIELSRTVNPTTGKVFTRILGFYSILHNADGTINVQNNTHQLPDHMVDKLAMRPTDILATLSSREFISSSMTGNNIEILPSADITGTNKLIQPVVVKKDLNIPTEHLAQTLTGIVKGISIGNQYDNLNVLDNAVSVLKTQNLEYYDISILKRLSMLNHGQIVAYFTPEILKQLIGHEPDPSKIQVIKSTGYIDTQLPPELTTQDSEDLYQPTLENQIVTTVVQSMTSILSKHALSRITLAVNNLTGEPTASVMNVNSFVDGLDVVSMAEHVKNLFLLEIFPTISYNNTMPIEILMDVNIIGDSVITIALNGNPFITYRIPTFADALFAPVISNKQHFNTVTNNYKELIDIVNYELTEMN